MRTLFFISILCLSYFTSVNAQVFDVNDPIVNYDELNPPSNPPSNTVGKWIRTPGVSWNTDKWKSYIINGMPFRLRFPNNYDPNRQEEYPMIVILHGLGFQGGDKYMNERHLNNSGAKAYEDGINSNRFDGFVLSPQADGGWFNQNHVSNIDKIILQADQDLNFDINRVSVNGRSGGAQSVWVFMQAASKTYAAAAPMAGVKSSSTDNIDAYKHMPLWIFQGELDTGPSSSTVEAIIDEILAKKGNVKYTKYKNAGHGIFDKGYAESDYFTFYSSVHKANPAIMAGEYANVFEDNNKWVYEFLEKNELCPGDPINVRLGLTAGFDDYEWRKDGTVISSANSNEYVATSFGVYEARFKRGNVWSVWSPSPVEIKLKEVTSTPDIKLVENVSAYLPSLDGATSVQLELPQGYASYQWRSVSDNSIVSINRVFEATSTGEYKALVVENFGCSSDFSNIYTVKNANGVNGPKSPLALNGVAISKTAIKLVWSLDPNDINQATEIEVFRSKSISGPYEFVTAVNPNNGSYTDEGLIPDNTYYYQVRAINQNAASAAFSSNGITTLVDIVKPTTPAELSIVGVNSYSVSLNWGVSTDDVEVYRYDVYRDGVKVTSVDTTAATIFNLVANKIYTFRVKARDLTGNESPFSNRVVAVTTVNNASLTNLKFNDDLMDLGQSNVNSSFSGNLSFSSTDKVEGSASLAVNGNGYIDLDLNNVHVHDEFSEKSISFWVKQTSTTGIQDVFDEGGSGNGIAFRVNAGTMEFAVRNGGIQRTIAGLLNPTEWNHVVGVFNNGKALLYINGSKVDEDLNVPFSTINAHGNGAGLGGTNSSNAFGQTSGSLVGFMDDFYLFETALGLSQVQSLGEMSSLVSIPDEEIGAPSNVTATVVSYKEIALTWNDNSTNETQFQIYRAKEGEAMQAIAIVPANTTSYSDEGLSPATKYIYQVEALTAYNSVMSEVSTVNSLLRMMYEDNLSDDSNNGTVIQNIGAISYVSDNVQGSKAISFNGSSYLNVDNNNRFIHSEFTERSIAFWYKSLGASGTQDIYDEGGSTNGIGIRLVDTDLQLTVQNGHAIFSVEAAVSRNEWHHVLGIFQSGALRLYVDGALVAQRDDVSYTTVNAHGDAGGLGGTNGSNAFDVVSDRFTGLLDDFYVFDTAMDADLQSIMASANPLNEAITNQLPSPPLAIGDLTVVEVGYDYIDISFTDESTDEAYFEIKRAISNASNFQVLDTLPAMDGGTISFTDTGLEPHITYYYEVSAVNAGGSSESVLVSATTLNNAPELSDLPSEITIRYDSEYDVSLYGTDEDGDQLTITGSNLPSFASLVDYGDGSGLLRFSPQESDLAGSPYTSIVVSLSDAFGGVTSETISLVINNNHLPTLSPVTDLTITEGGSSLINMIASDVEGTADLSWNYDLPSFANISVNIDGTAELAINPSYSDHGVYASTVTVTDVDGAIATSEFTITVLDTNPNEQVFVNFRQNTNAGSGWNNIGGLGVHALTTSAGASSGASLELQTSSWKVYNQGAQTGNNSGVFPDAVLKDYYYFGIFGAPETVTMKLSGLDPNTTYNYSFVASSIWTGVPDNGTTVYTIGTTSASVNAQNNRNSSANINGVKPNASGEVYVVMSKAAGSPAGYLNGFSMSSVYGADEVPAPPRSLKAALSGSSVALTWIDAPYNEDGFNIYRSETSSGPYTQIGTVGADIESYSDGNISEGVTYYYVVSAYNGVGESAYSAEYSFTAPNTPPVISITGGLDIYVNQTTTIVVTVSDSPSNTVSVDVSGLPSFASYAAKADGGDITLTPTLTDIGSYMLTVVATDNLGAESVEQLALTVAEEDLYSVSINFGKNTLASSPWNNTAKSPAQGDIFGNLKDEGGVNTGISVSLQTAFGGFYNEGATTGNNSGVVPDNVLKEYYYWGIFGAPEEVSMKVSGLDYRNKYTVSFVASTTFRGAGVTDNGETVYTIGNKSVSLDVESNTDRMVTISGVTASHQGEIIIKMNKGIGASVGYINGMVITAYAGDPATFYPGDLAAQALDASSIGLTWTDNSFNEQGFLLYRASTEAGQYTMIGAVEAGVTNYVDAGLPKGDIFYYKVRAYFRGGTYSAYTNIVASGTISYYVYVNVNGVPQYDADVPWNNLSVETVSGDVFTGFYNQDGDPTGMALEVINGMQGSNDWGASTGDNSGVYPDEVMKSFYFSDRLEAPGEFKISGLDGGYNYNLKFFGSIVTGFDIVTNFSAGGYTVSNNQTDNISEVSTIYGLEASSDGEISFTVQEAPNSTWAIFNAFVLEAYPKETSDVFARGSLFTTSKVVIGDYQVRYGKTKSVVSFYPNPANGYFNIRIDDAPAADAYITMVDIMGRVIFTKTQFLNEVSTEIRIDQEISGLQPGMYLFTVQIAGETQTNRIIIK
ncbi:MAG: putative esterase [Sediminicola sp.]|jgi:predicted esterase